MDRDLCWHVSLVGLCLEVSNGLRSGVGAGIRIPAKHAEAALNLSCQGVHGIGSAHLHSKAIQHWLCHPKDLKSHGMLCHAKVLAHLYFIVVLEFPERMRALDSMCLHRMLVTAAADS